MDPINHIGTREVFDIIDGLRDLEVSNRLDIPELVVCGDQSSGKSSVLAAISGLAFPTKDTLCTRYAIELILRNHDGERSLTASIEPAPEHDEMRQEELRTFQHHTTNMDEFTAVLEKASDAMGIRKDRTFGQDTLRVKVVGPGLPCLTVVDLPGIFHGRGRHQSETDKSYVKGLVMRYMQRPRTIILAIISAKSELANQEVTALAQQLDPRGMRTLGIITKPDALDDSPGLAAEFVEVAQNKVIHFQMGWHVLKNPSQRNHSMSMEAREKSERKFLAQGVWEQLPDEHKGIVNLKSRLSRILYSHIVQNLPSLILDLEAQITHCQATLDRLADKSGRLEEVQESLDEGRLAFESYMSAAAGGRRRAVNGSGGSVVVTDLRAAVERLLEDLKHTFRTRGRAYDVVDDVGRVDESAVPPRRSRKAVLADVESQLEKSGGLPSQVDFDVVAELFYDYAARWPQILREFGTRVSAAVGDAVESGVTSSFRGPVQRGVSKHLAVPALAEVREAFKGSLQQKTDRLRARQPVTFSREVLDEIPRAFVATLRSHLNERLPDVAASVEGGVGAQLAQSTSVRDLAEALTSGLHVNRFYCDSTFACMSSYYQKELDKLLLQLDIGLMDEILLGKLPSLISRHAVNRLTPKQLEGMVARDNSVSMEGAFLRSRLRKIKTARDSLKGISESDAQGRGSLKRKATEIPESESDGESTASE